MIAWWIVILIIIVVFIAGWVVGQAEAPLYEDEFDRKDRCR